MRNKIKAIAPMLLAAAMMTGCDSNTKTQAMFDNTELAKAY